MTTLAPTLQAFFTDRLIRERRSSQNTIATYRDTWKLLLKFASENCHRAPSLLDIEDVNAEAVSAFLDHLEVTRQNSIRTRNVRLAAIHSVFRYAALRHPEHAATIGRVLAIPTKRFERALVDFLSESEVSAILSAPNLDTSTGRRDRVLMLLAIQSGLRISELIGLRLRDVHLGDGAHVSCHGKGRKDRITPLTKSTVEALRAWLDELPGEPDFPLFPNQTGRPLTRDAVERRISKHHANAAISCPTLTTKKVTAHVFRHTAAMRLLEAGVDTTVIALWLGHEQVNTTTIYLHAELGMKERVLELTKSPNVKPGRYRAPDALLSFLEDL